jgi:HTH-type transcriptional regulator / antitoxin HigA
MIVLNQIPTDRENDSRLSDRGDQVLVVWPIRTEDDYLRARDVVDSLAIKGEAELTHAERDQLEIFSMLMEAYEEVHHPIKPSEVSPVDFLRRLARESGMTESDLGRLLGDRSLGHRILNGQRQLSKNHIRIVCNHFRVDADAFL